MVGAVALDCWDHVCRFKLSLSLVGTEQRADRGTPEETTHGLRWVNGGLNPSGVRGGWPFSWGYTMLYAHIGIGLTIHHISLFPSSNLNTKAMTHDGAKRDEHVSSFSRDRVLHIWGDIFLGQIYPISTLNQSMQKSKIVYPLPSHPHNHRVKLFFCFSLQIASLFYLILWF